MPDNATDTPQPSEAPAKRWWQTGVFWTALGVGVALGALLLALWQEFSKPAVAFEIAVDHGPFDLPHRMPQAIFESAIAQGDTEALEQLLEDVVEETLDTHINGYMALSITNVGNQPAQDLAVQWNTTGYAGIQRIAETERTVRPFNNRIEIGELGTQETVTVSLWTVNRFVPGESEPPTLAYSTGSQAIETDETIWWTIAAVGIYAASLSIVSFVPLLRSRRLVREAIALHEEANTHVERYEQISARANTLLNRIEALKAAEPEQHHESSKD